MTGERARHPVLKRIGSALVQIGKRGAEDGEEGTSPPTVAFQLSWAVFSPATSWGTRSSWVSSPVVSEPTAGASSLGSNP